MPAEDYVTASRTYLRNPRDLQTVEHRSRVSESATFWDAVDNGTLAASCAAKTASSKRTRRRTGRSALRSTTRRWSCCVNIRSGVRSGRANAVPSSKSRRSCSLTRPTAQRHGLRCLWRSASAVRPTGSASMMCVCMTSATMSRRAHRSPRVHPHGVRPPRARERGGDARRDSHYVEASDQDAAKLLGALLDSSS